MVGAHSIEMLLKYYFNETFLGEEKTKTIEDKRMVELDLKTKISPKMPYLGIYQKNQHIHVFGSWSFLLVHIRFTPSGGNQWLCKMVL